MTENKTTSDCTIYAFVGTAILAISLVVAMYVGNDFHQSLFVESIIFVGSNILLWAIFISMVNYPYELMTIGSNRKTKKNVVEAEPATEQEQPKQTLPQTESVKYSHEDTDDAPVFPKVWAQIEPLIEGLPLVAHNKPFDEGCLKAVFRVYQMDYPDYEFYDTLCVSRQVLPDLENHQLQTVAAACGSELEDHHHALADAEACAWIAREIL